MTEHPIIEIPDEPVTELSRYGLYDLRPDEETGRWEPHRICTTELDGVGTALARLAEDREEGGDTGVPIIAVFDRQERRWLSGLWKGER